MFKRVPLLPWIEFILDTDFKRAVGPFLSLPYIADMPPSAKGSLESLPSAEAPTLCPMGICAETV